MSQSLWLWVLPMWVAYNFSWIFKIAVRDIVKTDGALQHNSSLTKALSVNQSEAISMVFKITNEIKSYYDS